ncbi:MAG: hypothetical protein AAGA85_14140 [Bacteroidota bacterium]
MDIQSIKIELVQRLLEIDQEKVLQRVKEVIEEAEDDFWDDLSVQDKAAIDEGLAQLDRGEFVSEEEVKKEWENRFKQ